MMWNPKEKKYIYNKSTTRLLLSTAKDVNFGVEKYGVSLSRIQANYNS